MSKKYIPPPQRVQEWLDQIAYCIEKQYLLNEDEQGLIDSCDITMSKKGVISRKQSSWLRNIFNRIS